MDQFLTVFEANIATLDQIKSGKLKIGFWQQKINNGYFNLIQKHEKTSPQNKFPGYFPAQYTDIVGSEISGNDLDR